MDSVATAWSTTQLPVQRRHSGGEVIQRDCCCVFKQELDEDGQNSEEEGFDDNDPAADAQGIEGGGESDVENISRVINAAEEIGSDDDEEVSSRGSKRMLYSGVICDDSVYGIR